jgi:hypothetical protein
VLREVSVPIWLLVALNAGWVAVAILIRRFRHADLRDALRVARDLEMDARFAALKEKAGRTFREAMLALSVERMALSGQPLPAAAYPHPLMQTPALVEVVYQPAPASGHRYSWPAVDRKAPAVPTEAVLTSPAEASQVRRQTRVATVPDRGGNDKAGRHRLPKSRWLSDETRQFSSAEVLDAALGESS